MAEEKSKSTEITFKTGKTTSGKNVAHQVFLQNYASLTKLLFITNLTPHLIQEEIIVPRDQEELNAIPTSAGKAAFVLQKVSSALETGEIGSFHKILEIMKLHGNSAAQQLSTTIEYEIAGSQKGAEPVTDKMIDNLSLEFSALLADIAEILDKSAYLPKFKLVCCSITTPEKSLVFGEKKSAAIRAGKSVYDVFHELRDHWRWDSHRLLFTLIKRTGSQDAMERFKQFEKKINFAKKLIDLSDYFQSINKAPPPGYTRMTAIIEKDYADFSLGDCKELEEYIATYFGSGSESVNPGHWENSNSIKVTWYIPTEAVSSLLSKAHQAKEIFQLLSISYFEIDDIIVYNKKWPYSLQAIQDSKSEMKHHLKEFEDERSKLGKQIKSLTEQLKEKEALIKRLQQTTDEKDQQIRALSVEKAKLEGESGFESMKESMDQAGKHRSKESSAEIEDINKNMAIFKLETELDEQARSFTVTLNAKDAEMDKMQSELKKKSEELQKVQAEIMQMKPEAKIKDDQVKGQKKESVHTIKMKYDDMQVKYRQKDIHVQHLKKQLDEAEKKVASLEKIIDVNGSKPKESDRAASENLEVKTKQVNSLQRQLKDLEDQNRNLAEKLKNESEQMQIEINKLKEENQKLKSKKPVSADLGYHSKEIDTLPEDSLSLTHMQAQEDLLTLRSKNSELSTEVEQLRAEVSQVKRNNSQLDNESKRLREQNRTLQNKEQQLQRDLSEMKNQKFKEVKSNEGLQAQIKSLEEEVKTTRQQLLECTRKTNSNAEAVRKEMSDQVNSYLGIIDENEATIAKLQSDLKKYESKQLEQVKHQQVIPQTSEATINFKAITEELNDQVNSYVRLIDEKDKIIEKLQGESKKLREGKEKEPPKKPQVEHKVQLRDDKEKEQIKARRREGSLSRTVSMYDKPRASLSTFDKSGGPELSAELQEKLLKRRVATDKDNQ